MAKEKTTYPEIDSIKQDLDSLRSNVVELTKHVKSNKAAQGQEMKEMLAGRLEGLKASGMQSVDNIERQVKAQPGKAVGIAFAAGLAASLLLGRR